jgi:hypothetical protein
MQLNDLLAIEPELYWDNLGEPSRPWTRSRLLSASRPYIVMDLGDRPFEEVVELDLTVPGGELDVYLYEVLFLDAAGIPVEFRLLAQLAERNGIRINVYTCEPGAEAAADDFPNLTVRCYDAFIRDDELSVLDQCKTPKIQSLSSNAALRARAIQNRFWHGASGRPTNHRFLMTLFLMDHDAITSWANSGLYQGRSWRASAAANVPFIPPVYAPQLIANEQQLRDYELVIDGQYRWMTDTYLQSIFRSAISIVSETKFDNPFANFSEKLLHCAALRQPFILVAPPKTLAYARALGFKTFDRWWPEAYDGETDHTRRLQMIFNTLTVLSNLSIQDHRRMRMEMTETLDINHQAVYALPTNGTVL